MNILACIKRVPATGGVIALTADEQELDTRFLGFTVSPHEECAVEEALRLKEAHGGSVLVLSLGPEAAQDQLRDTLAMGADDVLLLETDGREWDAAATAGALVAAVKAEPAPFDLLLFGNESADAGGYQVPVRVAHLLGLPCLTGVKSLTVTGRTATAKREMPGGWEVYEVELPAVISVKDGAGLVAVFLATWIALARERLRGRRGREFGVVVAGSVFISAFVSLSLTPMMSTRLLKHREKPGRFYAATEPFFVRAQEAYRSSLASFLHRRWLVFPVLMATVAAAALLLSVLKNELSPLEDRSAMIIRAEAQEGATFEYMDAFMDTLIRKVSAEVPEALIVLSVTSPGFAASSAVNTGFMRLFLSDPADRTRTQQEIAAAITPKLRGMSGARVFAIQEPTIQSGARGGLDVQMVIQAPDFAKLREALPKFVEEARKSPVFTIVNEDLKFNKPELRVDIDRERMRSLGVSVIDVAQALQLAFSGLRFDYFIRDGRQYQVIGQVDREFRNEPSDLRNIQVKNREGRLIGLDNLVTFEEQINPPQLFRYNRWVSATVSAGLAPGMTVGDGVNAMQEVADRVLEPAFKTALVGQSRDFAEASSGLYFAVILAILLVYLVLSAQFESFRDPLIVMVTVPLAVCGALLSLWFFNQTLNIFSKIGIIMLVGLVTKNGILIVEFANQRRRAGLSLVEAVRDASAARFRPIVMTTLSTALGALPIAVALGAASKSRMPMGIAVIGGLLFSLVLTLYVVPAMYTFFAKKADPVPLGADVLDGRE